MNNLEIGSNIKRYRKEKNLTQQQLAELINRTESSIRKYEKGLVEIPNSVLSHISKVLDINIMDLLGSNAYQYKIDALDLAILEYEEAKKEPSLPMDLKTGYDLLRTVALKEKERLINELNTYLSLKELNTMKYERKSTLKESLKKEGLSDDEINDIKNYIDFIKSKRTEDLIKLGETIKKNNATKKQYEDLPDD